MVTPVHHVIVGGGCAGLAIAELLARSGYNVVLVEQWPSLFGESSGKQHGWFHTGSLYSLERDALFLRTMVRNVEILLRYYRDFPGMNLEVDSRTGKLRTRPGSDGWFNGEQSRLLFVVEKDTLADDDTVYLQHRGLTWAEATTLLQERLLHFGACDWRRGSASRFIPAAGFQNSTGSALGVMPLTPTEFRARLDSTNLDPSKFDAFVGYDRSMNVGAIQRDLTKSLLFHGGTILCDTKFLAYRCSFGRVQVDVEGPNGPQTIEAERLVQAMGRNLRPFYRDAVLRKVRTVASPLLVVTPAISETNFQVMSPRNREVLNHIRHSFEGQSYSLIGDNSAAPPDDALRITQARTDLGAKARRLFPELKGKAFPTYVCNKSELSADAAATARSYSYIIEQMGEDVFAVIPGKLSLCFSLAVETFHRLLSPQHEPWHVVGPEHEETDPTRYVAPLHHQRIVVSGLGDNAAEDIKPNQSRDEDDPERHLRASHPETDFAP